MPNEVVPSLARQDSKRQATKSPASGFIEIQDGLPRPGTTGSVAGLLQAHLHEVDIADPATLFTVALMSTLVAALACWLPARRAAAADRSVGELNTRNQDQQLFRASESAANRRPCMLQCSELLEFPMFTTNELLASPVLVPLQQRNTFFDAWFYDVTALTADERLSLDPLANAEGSLIVVPPTDTAKPIRHYRSIDDLLANERGPIRGLAIAGVGSSVLGTAALARNVADARQADCLGIVSGYGVVDLFTEALGGWFFYGAVDAAKQALKTAIERPRRQYDAARRAQNAHCRNGSVSHPLESRIGGSDASAAIALIGHLPSLDLIVGHSKGALILDFALEHLAQRSSVEADCFARLRIVTLGAVVDLPKKFKHRHQYIGAVDWFGGMNSRISVDHERVRGSWHHLNRRLPMHLDVPAVLAEVLDA
jgi:hypothetical protein